METIFVKLNLRLDVKQRRRILVVNAPPSFEPQIAALTDASVDCDATALDATSFALAFVTAQAKLDAVSATIAQRAVGDALPWFAYPRPSTKTGRRCAFDATSSSSDDALHGRAGLGINKKPG